MPMPVMNIGQMIMLMFLGGMFMLMRVDSVHIVVRVSKIAMSVAVLVRDGCMYMGVSMVFIDEQQRTADYQNSGDDE